MSTERPDSEETIFESADRAARQVFEQRVKEKLEEVDGSPYNTGGNGDRRAGQLLDDQRFLDFDRDKCQNCGMPLNADTRRQFGDESHVMWVCWDCPEVSPDGAVEIAPHEIRDGLAARPGEAEARIEEVRSDAV